MRLRITAVTLASFAALLGSACSDVEQSESNQVAQTRHGFECVTDKKLPDGKKHTMRFSVVDLKGAASKIDLVWPEDDGDNSDCPGCPITVKPTDSDLSALNENAVIKRKGGKLIMEGDADGFYWVTLALYENSGYTKGYVRVDDGGGFVDEAYSKVTCTVTEESAAPQRADVSEVVGFYNNGDHDYEVSAPLLVALYPASDKLAAGYDGYVDLTMWDAQAEDTTLTRGWFKLTGSAGNYELKVVNEKGKALAGGTWKYADRDLKLKGGSLYHLNELSGDEYVEQCYGMQVHAYELEESFTPYEYPGVDVSVDAQGNYEVSIGSSSWDHNDAEITVDDDADGNFEATVKTEWSTYVVRVPNSSPRRGEILYSNEGSELDVMADIGCYPK